MSPATGPTCSQVAARLGEPTAGTASRIRSWVLLEHDGPWGADTREEVFAEVLGARRWAELEELWLERDLRPLLVRRPAGHPESGRGARAGRGGRPPRVLVGSIGPTPFLEVSDVDALATMDLQALADGRPGHGRPVLGPALLVCTNGAVDRCCALAGRPLVAALAERHPDLVWESTHLGGCRFAANLLVLPSGHMHGRLTPEDGLAVVEAALAGRVDPTGWRGRAGQGSWESLALATVAAREGVEFTSLHVAEQCLHDDVVDGEEGPEPAGCDVVVTGSGGRWLAVLRTEVLAPRTSACDDEPPWPTPVVTALTPHP